MVKLMQTIPTTHYQGILQAYCERLSQSHSETENKCEKLENTIFFEDLICF